MYVVLCLIVFGCQYRCNWLPGKTRLWMTYYMSSGTLNPTHSLTHPYLNNQWREFHPILVTDLLGLLDVLIRFCGQHVKGQGHSRQWPKNLVNTISPKLEVQMLSVIATVNSIQAYFQTVSLDVQDLYGYARQPCFVFSLARCPLHCPVILNMKKTKCV